MSSSGWTTRRLVITAVLIAISIVLAIPIGVPPLQSLGFISLGPYSITFMHVPAIIGAILEGPVVGFIVGGAFGAFSLFNATQSANPGDALFRNPLISILPRLFIGPVAWLVWQALKKNPMVGLIASAIAGTLTNTVLVVGSIVAFGGVALGVLIPLVAPNVPFELVIAVVIVVAVVGALRGITGNRRGSSV